MKNLIICLVVTILLVFFLSCEKKVAINIEKEKAGIKKSIDNAIGWAKEKDLDLLFRIIANDSSYLSVHPNDRIVRGFGEFKENVPFWMNPDFQYVKHDISDLIIHLSKAGDVAWFYCKLNDRNIYKGQPASWLNTRWTGVLEKRNNHWVIVQQHFSFAQD